MKIQFLADEVKLETGMQFAGNILKAYQVALRVLKQKFKRTTVNVIFVSGQEMQEINYEKRNINAVTDVLSFPMLTLLPGQKVRRKDFKTDYDKKEKTLLLGDILICLSQAEKQAEELNHSIMREVVFLAVHGLLHLYGYDHQDEQQEKVMTALQEYVLNKINLKRKGS